MVIGTAWLPEIAVQGFHSGAGWWNLTLVALATVMRVRFQLFGPQSVAKGLK